MLQYEKVGVRPSRKDLWIKTLTRKYSTPIDADPGEVILCFNHDVSNHFKLFKISII